MNTYSFNFALDSTGTLNWKATDSMAATLLCRSVGYLWLAGKYTDSRADGRTGSGKFKPKDITTSLDFMTPKRLPQALDLPDTGQVFSGDGIAMGILASQDDQASDRLQNLDRPIVTRGSLIVAITLGGVDISNELQTQLRIPVGIDANGTQYLNIGTAAADAQDGVYQTPFSTALAFATLGTGKVTNTPIVVTTSR